MESALSSTHKKWSKIQNEIDKKQHKQILRDAATPAPASPPPLAYRSGQRVFGSRGTLEVLLRKEYQKGLSKLNTNSFESKEAKEAFLAFTKDLTPKELAIAQDTEWE